MTMLKDVTMKLGSDFKLFVGGAATAGSSGILSLITAPVLVSALIAGLKVEERTAGSLTSAELITVSLTSFLIAPKMGKLPRRKLALAGAIIAILGHSLSAMMPDIGLLVPVRIIAGIGGGLMVAAGNASIASAKDPDRIYSLIVMFTGVTQLVMVSIGPLAVGQWSYSGGYLLETVFILLMLPLIVTLPQYGRSLVSGIGKRDEPYPFITVAAVCLMIMLYFSRDSSLWSFSQEISMRAGIAKESVGFILGMTGIVAILGAGTAAVLSTRWGRLKPLLFGLITNMILAYWISQTSNAWVFIIVEYVYHFVLFFTVPYMFGLAATLDAKGRAMAAAGGAMLFGASIGPGVGGFLISGGGYTALGMFILFAMSIALVLAIYLHRRVERQAAGTATVVDA
jgi:predicted MFS family arabinose efflux permease